MKNLYTVVRIYYDVNQEQPWRWADEPTLEYVLPSPFDVNLRESDVRHSIDNRETMGQEYLLYVRSPQGWEDCDYDRQTLYFRLGAATETSVFGWTHRVVTGYGRLYVPIHKFVPTVAEWEDAHRVDPEDAPLGPVRWEIYIQQEGAYKNNRIVEDPEAPTGYREERDDE